MPSELGIRSRVFRGRIFWGLLMWCLSENTVVKLGTCTGSRFADTKSDLLSIEFLTKSSRRDFTFSVTDECAFLSRSMLLFFNSEIVFFFFEDDSVLNSILNAFGWFETLESDVDLSSSARTENFWGPANHDQIKLLIFYILKLKSGADERWMKVLTKDSNVRAYQQEKFPRVIHDPSILSHLKTSK